MLVKFWMTPKVITIDEDVSIVKASKLMNERGMQHLPVTKNSRLVGIISDRDLKEAQSSNATSLHIHELHYLLEKLKVKEIMPRKLYTTNAETPVDKAAALMLKHNISALPVVDNKGNLEGIITKGDVFRAMATISGIYQAPLQLGLELEDQPGSMNEVTEMIRAHGGRIVSIINTYHQAPENFRHVYIRTKDVGDENALLRELNGKFRVLYKTHDEMG
jgi:acetoin utilization protein AcuB